ncbi:2Fe-2S iron-sulfur cluster-binding protein [Psychromonas sp. Urea-02u-13]|uniref:2Fe-2S iron-sulfur cluster-binding protein n=1 Tax=Psychromonas sp. Urea-02u-13 TaxID=2058326 RepID=UPI000C346397|nr:hypothetical protein CXF74_16485 [Psychromonas sp. Urea-02u-13]
MYKGILKFQGFQGQVDSQVVNLKPTQSILTSILDANIDMPYKCLVGTCLTCMCRIESGKTRYLIEVDNIISAEKIKLGYVLACQAIPESDLIICTTGCSGIYNRPNMRESVTYVD